MTTGSLDITLKVFAGLFLLALIISIFLKRAVNLADKKVIEVPATLKD
jgi:MFS transporter, OFA family, oxalate/formate antiporter